MNALTELVVLTVGTEAASLRAQIDMQVTRATHLSSFSVVAAAAILTLLATADPSLADAVTVALVVAAALALTQLSFIGIVGETLQAGDYLRDQGDFIRELLSPALPETFEGRNGLTLPPVLAWEELAARRTRASRWITLTSSLAALEGLAAAIFGVVIFVAAILTLADQTSTRTPLNLGIAVVDAGLVVVTLGVVWYMLRVQDRRAVRPEPGMPTGTPPGRG